MLKKRKRRKETRPQMPIILKIKRAKTLVPTDRKIEKVHYTMILDPLLSFEDCLFDTNNWLAPVFVTVDPAGIIAVWIRWERADDGGGIKAMRRCDEGDSVRVFVWRRSPPGSGCFRGVNCRSLMDRRSSPREVVVPSGQWTCDFFKELLRETLCGVVLVELNFRLSWLGST